MDLVLAFVLLFLFDTPLAYSLSTPSFSDFLQRVNAAEPSARPALVDSFMAAQKSFPVTEDSMANFVYRGNVSSLIVVTGDHTQWSSSGQVLSNIPFTDFYYQSRKFESDARIDYKFVKDGVWILDPLNPRTVTGGFGPNSELAMPAYVQPSEIQYDGSIAHGTIISFSFASVYAGNTRTIAIYLPPHYDSSDVRYSTLYVHDGSDYLSLGSMATVLDNLIEAKKIQPLIAVFVPPGADRPGEYRQSKITQFSEFMTKELVPYIDSVYRTDSHASRRGTMGSSDGGHIALYLAVKYSEVFGLAAGQSSTITDLLRTPIQQGPKVPAKFFLDVGTYDLTFQGVTFLDANRSFRDLLKAKGYEITYAEYHEGHSWGNWRAHIDEILKAFYPFNPTGVAGREQGPGSSRIFNAYPNPFNPIIYFQFSLPEKQSVNVTMYDLQGRAVAVLMHRDLPQGAHTTQWNAAQYASGIYLCRFVVSGKSETQKIVLLK